MMMDRNLRNVARIMADRWALSLAERRRLYAYLRGRRTSAQYDGLSPYVKAVVDGVEQFLRRGRP